MDGQPTTQWWWWWSWIQLDHQPPFVAYAFQNGRDVLKRTLEGVEKGTVGAVLKTRQKVLAPILWVAICICLAMSMMLFVEALLLGTISLYVKLLGRNPEKRYDWKPIVCTGDDNAKDDEGGGGGGRNIVEEYPMVLIQIPMYNEKEVYRLSIGAACALTWPPDRIIIQVLDDSTDPEIKELVELECREWSSKGMNIKYKVRDNRRGYKAGALKEGMAQSYVQECEFVAIFDADFQPPSDFLIRTIPFLTSNSDVGLIQARWEFVNYDECLLTRLQKMTLDYHFKVEQEAGSSAFAFFGFNGTAGVWRISAMDQAGGWKDRTTVEDMDLAVCATLKGWKFIYVGSLKVKSELPSNFKAYRNQQQRWTCGAANLFRKMIKEIVEAKEVSFFKKLYLFYSFFFLRKVVAHVLSCVFYCMVIPIGVFVPEVQIPSWGVIYVPTTITILHAMRSPSSIHLLAVWIVFENVMSFHRLKATMIGLFEARGVDEWVVTDKLGEALLDNHERQMITPEKASRFKDRINIPEIFFAIFLSICATYNLLYAEDFYYAYIFLQAIAFFVVGFGYVGTFVSTS